MKIIITLFTLAAILYSDTSNPANLLEYYSILVALPSGIYLISNT